MLPFFEKISELMEHHGFQAPYPGEDWDKADKKLLPFLEWVGKRLRELESIEVQAGLKELYGKSLKEALKR